MNNFRGLQEFPMACLRAEAESLRNAIFALTSCLSYPQQDGKAQREKRFRTARASFLERLRFATTNGRREAWQDQVVLETILELNKFEQEIWVLQTLGQPADKGKKP